MTTLSENINTRILEQFKDSTLEDFIVAINDGVQDARDILEYLQELDLDTAEGVWLDLYGLLVGVYRPLADWHPVDVFTTLGIDQVPKPSQGFLNTAGTIGGRLEASTGAAAIPKVPTTDEKYRRLIEAKATSNWGGSSIKDIWRYIYSSYGLSAEITIPSPREVLIDMDYDNLVVNGTFDDGITGWSGISSIISSVNLGGKNVLLMQYILPGIPVIVEQEISVSQGTRYYVYIHFPDTTLDKDFSLRVGTTSGGTEVLNEALDTESYAHAVLTYFDVPEATTSVFLQVALPPGKEGYVDKVYVIPYLSQSELYRLKEYSPAEAGVKVTVQYEPDTTRD